MPLTEPRISADVSLEHLRVMMLSRECDQRESILVRQGLGPFHVGAAGHEALSALAYSLRPSDSIFGYYRDRALAIARGYSLEQIARDFYGSKRSASGGANLPAHNSSKALGIFPVATPTGSQCLPAVGAAWAARRMASGDAVLCTVGDAATRQGEFYEAVCFAIQENLPIVFAIHDNGFGISTRTAGLLPFDFGVFSADTVCVVDASDFEQVADIGGAALSRARDGRGPSILLCKLDRLCSHTSSDDQSSYRGAAEIAAMAHRDPIMRYAQRLIAVGVLSESRLSDMGIAIHDEIDEIYRQAGVDEPATVSQMIATHFALEPAEPERPTAPHSPTMVAAINRTLGERLEAEPKALIFGQDIEDPKGGVFGFTKGLSTRFPDRVINAPLAEATMVGAGVGLAACGMQPIIEVQFIDFIAPAYQQLSAQAATLRWRSAGDWTCPMVIYAPYGAYLPSGGPWHSQSNEALFAHIPGVRVGVPSNPQDAADLFDDAFRCDDPTVMLIPKHVFRIKHGDADHHDQPLGFGKARVVRTGRHLTLVAWGNCVSLGAEAAVIAAEAGIDIELIDLRTLAPCDWETVSESVGKTGRIVVVQEDSRTCGFGQAVISEVITRVALFDLLKAAPILVSRPDSHVPFNADLEYAILPSINDLLQAFRTSTGFSK